MKQFLKFPLLIIPLFLWGCSYHEEQLVMDFTDTTKSHFKTEVVLPSRYSGWTLHFKPNFPTFTPQDDLKVTISVMNQTQDELYINSDSSVPDGTRFHLQKNDSAILYTGPLHTGISKWHPSMSAHNDRKFILEVHLNRATPLMTNFVIVAVCTDSP